MKLILSSNSPRRRELLAGLNVPFEVRTQQSIEETYPDTLPTSEVAEYVAQKKAATYEVGKDEVLITADTVVVLGETVLGKPTDAEEAKAMLQMLSGQTHRVITGVCIKDYDKQRHFSVVSEVTFKVLSEWEIDYYVNQYRPFDKAGAYGIQEWIGYIGVTGLRGSYFNVMGLPVQRIYEELTSYFGLHIS